MSTNTARQKALFVACKAGDVIKLTTLLETGHINVNFLGPDDLSPLMASCKFGRRQIVKILLEKEQRAELTFTNSNGYRALHQAAGHGHADIVELLLDHGADINATSKTGRSPLLLSCLLYKNKKVSSETSARVDCVRLLLDREADVNLHDKNYMTPLHVLCRYCTDTYLVQRLVSSGADLDLKTGEGLTPLMMACKQNFADGVQMLIKSGANLNRQTPEGNSAIQMVSMQENETCIRLLAQAGADLNAQDMDGASVLLNSVKLSFVDSIQTLLEYEIDVNMKNEDGDAPIHEAVNKDLGKRVLKLLLHKGADVNAQDSKGETALSLSIIRECTKAFKLLLSNKPDLTLCNKAGFTALHTACSKGDVTGTEALINAGADVDAQTLTGRTPAHVTNATSLACMVALIKARADLTLSDDNGNTALHLACKAGHNAFVEVLVGKSDVNARNKEAYTPLLLACEGGSSGLERSEGAFDESDEDAEEEFDQDFRRCAETLLDHGADANLVNCAGENALHAACSASADARLTDLLLTKGADTTFISQAFAPLHHAACSKDNAAVIDTFAAHKADLNIKTIDNHTALMLACQNGNLCIVKSLIKHRVLLDEMNDVGETAVYAACCSNMFDCVQALIEAGADLNLFGKKCCPPIEIAAMLGSLRSVELLLDAGVDVDVSIRDGATPLMLSSSGGHPECVTLLLSRGADVHHRDIQGANAAYMASEGGHLKCLKLLQRAGLDLNVILRFGVKPKVLDDEVCKVCVSELYDLLNKGGDASKLSCCIDSNECQEALEKIAQNPSKHFTAGYSPVHIAAAGGHLGCVKYLLEQGVNIAYDGENSPLSVAREEGQRKVVTLLQILREARRSNKRQKRE